MDLLYWINLYQEVERLSVKYSNYNVKMTLQKMLQELPNTSGGDVATCYMFIRKALPPYYTEFKDLFEHGKSYAFLAERLDISPRQIGRMKNWVTIERCLRSLKNTEVSHDNESIKKNEKSGEGMVIIQDDTTQTSAQDRESCGIQKRVEKRDIIKRLIQFLRGKK